VFGLTPADGLRLLFGLESDIYQAQGQLAVAYGGGTHTKHRHTRYHEFFAERTGKAERVLDVGCGNGALAHDIAEQAGADVVGIDLSAEMLEQARARYSHPRVEYRVGDAMKDMPDGAFDVVVLSNVLEHLDERPALLRRIREQTRAKRFLIRVPLFERDWRVPLKKELGVEWRLDGDHKTEYTLESFADEMAEAGLEIVHQEVRWGEIWAEAAVG